MEHQVRLALTNEGFADRRFDDFSFWCFKMEPVEGLEPPVFVYRFTKAVLSPLSHTGKKSNPGFIVKRSCLGTVN